MRRVVDASAAFKWLVTEVDSDKANRLREDFRRAVDELLAPDILPVEIAHGVTRAERRGLIADAEAAWRDLMSACPALHFSMPLMERAIEISRSARIGVYDCIYVALAEREGCEMVTADERLVKNLQSDFPFVVPLSSL